MGRSKSEKPVGRDAMNATANATGNATPLVWAELWAAMRAKFDAGGPGWVPTTGEMFEHMLCVLPPHSMRPGAFLVGEPWSHRGREAVYAAFRVSGGAHSARYMTVAEFDAEFPKDDARAKAGFADY